MTDLTEKRNKLCKVYKDWEKQINGSFKNKQYSFPYYIGIPEDWYEKDLRIMIVGEEGAGDKQYNIGIEEAQKFNLEYMNSQLGKSKEYRRNGSSFWKRFRDISKRFPTAALCWNNLDKVHISRRCSGKLNKQDREELHQTKIKILQKELEILEPTHIIFFGWYGVSLKAELPEMFNRVYPNGNLKDQSRWKGKPPFYERGTDRRYYVFTYHPGWRGKPENYEDTVLQELEKAVEEASHS